MHAYVINNNDCSNILPSYLQTVINFRMLFIGGEGLSAIWYIHFCQTTATVLDFVAS